MENELTYQSEFTGLEMDARFTAVAQLTDALEALTAVVAQKYVKPASGIPSTDMDADVQAALAKANTAVQSLADYYTKSEVDQLLAAINGMDYVDVATLPTASASTLGKIYLVGPDASGYYAYYYTSYDGSAYSWVGPLGTTQISLANYATKAELSQLDQEVNGDNISMTATCENGTWLFVKLPIVLKRGKKYTFVISKSVNQSGSNVSTSTSPSTNDRVDIEFATFPYFADTPVTATLVPSGDADYLAFWCGKVMDVSFSITSDGISQGLAKTMENVADLQAGVSNLNELIPALGKGETVTLTPTVYNGYIDADGEVQSGSQSKYSEPIALSKGEVIILYAFTGGMMSPVSLTDSTGSFYEPVLGAGVGNNLYIYYATSDCHVAVSYQIHSAAVTPSITKTTLTGLISIVNELNAIRADVDGLMGKNDYSATFPPYVFGIESGSFVGREYATAIYPEAIINKPESPGPGIQPSPKKISKGLLNGEIRMLMQKAKQDSSAYNNFRTKTETVEKSAVIGGPGLLDKPFTFDYIRANRYNGQNKNMFLLVIGASITQQGGYLGQIDRLGDMDNTDIGNIKVKSLGSNVGTVTPSITYKYGDQTKTITTHTEGRAGWTTYGIANWPFEARMDGAVNTFGGEGMWYAAGFATKTPYDSSTPGQTAESWTGSAEQKCALFSAVFGRYKPDYCEALWTALHNFHEQYRSGAHTIWYYSTGAEYTTGATVPAYSAATSDPIMEQFFEALVANPDNVFYDRSRAREHTGAYVWTNKTAFSIEKWVERYRTLDDNGNQLTLGEGTGTLVTQSNINNPVCTPTFVLCGMGANDPTGMKYDDWSNVSGTTDAVKRTILDLLDDVHSQLPTAHLGWGCPRQSGVFFPEKWYGTAIIGEMTFYTSNRSWLNNLMLPEMPELDVENDYNYVPFYFTSSPVSGQTPHYVGDFDNPNGDKLVVAGKDLGHVGTEWEESVAYQILAWMYWCLQ